MPKYKNKMQLKRLGHNEPDQLSRYLVLSGYTEKVVSGGLAGLVKEWEEAVDWLVKGFDCIEEWTNDLSAREILANALEILGTTPPQSLIERIEAADQRLRAATCESSRCVWGDGFSIGLEKCDPVKHWYYFRWPNEE